MNTANASLLAIDQSGDVAIEIAGQGVWRCQSATGWQQLNTANASLLAMDQSGDLAAEFSTSIVYRYYASWLQLTTSSATLIVA